MPKISLNEDGPKQHIVTVKVRRAEEHDPFNKVRGICPVFAGWCSDITGQHHSVLVTADGFEEVRNLVEPLSGQDGMPEFTITRIEEV
jgi:hypothetical protein